MADSHLQRRRDSTQPDSRVESRRRLKSELAMIAVAAGAGFQY